MNSGIDLSSQDELNLQPGTSSLLLLFTIPTFPQDLEVMSTSSMGLPDRAGAGISHDSKPGKVIKKS